MKLKVLFLFILAFCLSQSSFGQQIPVSNETTRGYLIGPGDVLTVKVFGEPDFNVEGAIVDEDGKIQIPYSKGITAQCQTEKEVREQVFKIYSRLLKNPEVSVLVKERHSRPPVTIYGEVRSQQQVQLTRKASLLDILASAGGVTEKAGGLIQVFRTQKPVCIELTQENDWRNENGGVDIPSRIYSIGGLRQGSKESNPEVFPGDIIVVFSNGGFEGIHQRLLTELAAA